MVRFAYGIAALLASTVAAASPHSLTKVNTDKGEVLLEIVATGQSTAKISKISTVCFIRGSGGNKIEAESALAKVQSKFRSDFTQNGLNASMLDFSIQPIPSESEYAVEASASAVEATASAAARAGAAAAKAAADTMTVDEAARQYVETNLTQNVGVNLSNASEYQVAKAVMAGIGCEEDDRIARKPNIEIANPTSAKAAAVVDALKQARLQADGYANALNMRVVRTLRISETGAIREFLGTEADFIMQDIRGNRDRRSLITDDVPITASVSVDYVLSPK
jgi:hypothetical protein